MDAIIITGEELRAWGFDGAPDGEYLVGEWLLDWMAAEDEKSPGGPGLGVRVYIQPT